MMQQPGFGVPGQMPGQVATVPGQVPGQPVQVPAGATPASFDPETMTEGGGAPIQVNLTVKEASIVYYDYNGKAPQSVCSRLVFLTDQGETLNPQYYSIGDPTKFMPSADASQVMLLGGNSGINKGCNHGILMKGCLDAGFPKDLLASGNIKALEGLYAYWDGVTPPPRTGLAAPQGQQRKESVVSVPTVIHRLPGQPNTGPVVAATPVAPVAPAVVQVPVAPVAPGTSPMAVGPAPMAPAPVVPVAQVAPPLPVPMPAPAVAVVPPASVAPVPAAVPVAPVTIAPAQPQGAVDLNAYAHGMATSLGGSFSLQQAMNLVYSTYPNEAFRDDLATYLFSPEFSASLVQQGYMVQGHQISK